MSECNTVHEIERLQTLVESITVNSKCADCDMSGSKEMVVRMKRMEDALKQITLEHDTWNGKTIPTVAACMARKALEV